MFFSFIFTLLALGSFSSAHHMLTNIHINNVDQGPGTCVRIPPNTDPVVNITSPSMACNVGGEKPLGKFCAVDAGAVVKLQWRTWPDGSMNTPIDVSHQGPCAVYMKRIASFARDPAQGTGWFKVWQDGYRDGKFCTERLRASGGMMMNVTVPKDLEGGRYLLRAEHLALHQAQVKGGAQWYIGCVQIVVYSTGGSARPPGVSIPGHVSATNPGVLYDYWNNMHPSSYPIPGPAPYTPTNTGGGRRILVQYENKYTECLISNADWCAVSVPTFTNEETCWSAANNGWKQLATCYETAPATGHAGCTKWETQCTAYQSHCSRCGAARTCSGSFPTKRSIDILRPPIPGTKQKRHEHHHPRGRSTPDKLIRARDLCDEIAKVCKKDGGGGVCGVFGAACRGAVNPGVVGQFSEEGSRKWQALWLYKVACESEGFEKDECRQRFSRAVEGFE